MKKLYIRNQSEEMTLKELFAQFLVAKQCINVSPYTLRFYEGCYRHFTDYIDEETPCSEITLHTVNSYILALKGRSGINDITINTYLRGMRAILYYGMEIVCIKPFKIVLLRAEKKQKETYSAHEIAALIQKPDLRTCSFAEFRNWAIVNYLLATGNRLETLLNVKIGDIDFAENEIHLTKLKNRKQYTIPLSAQLSKDDKTEGGVYLMKKRMRIIVLTVLAVLLLLVGLFFGYLALEQHKRAVAPGNSDDYAYTALERHPANALTGKTILFLGSSVTDGAAAKSQSFVEWLAQVDGVNAIKEAKSGTTLVDKPSVLAKLAFGNGDSYVKRLLALDPSTPVDAVICQLSTNDATMKLAERCD